MFLYSKISFGIGDGVIEGDKDIKMTFILILENPLKFKNGSRDIVDKQLVFFCLF